MPNERLVSWRAIADYLRSDIATVKRWHSEKGLPVQRARGGLRQSVFAYTQDIDAWLKNNKAKLPNLRTWPKRLDSWKDIALYLGVDTRTAIRWEKRGLPIHRVPGENRSLVFAYKDEIDGWLKGVADDAQLREIIELDDFPDLTITFDATLSPEQVTIALRALADYYRACGGVGFKIDFELEDVRIGDLAHV